MKQQYIRVPYALLDSKASVETRIIYLVLLYFRKGNKKQIKVSQAKISEVAGIRVSQVSKHIKMLVKQKLISKSQNNYNRERYACNTYSLLCDETKYAIIPYKIAFNSDLKAFDVVAYSTMKRFTDLKKMDFICYMTKQDLAKRLCCSENQVDKTKRRLKVAGFIEFENNSNKIMLTYEQNFYIERQKEQTGLNLLEVIVTRNAQENTSTLQTTLKDGP